MPRRIVLSGEFDSDHVDALCDELAPVKELTSPATVRIDLSELQDLSASALAVLISTLRTAHANGLCNPVAEYVPPRSPALRTCLAPGNLDVLLGGGPSCPGNDDVAGFSGCEPFSSRDEVECAVASMLAWLRGKSHPEIDTLFAIEAIAWDLAMNVLQHAEIGGGVIALKLDEESKAFELAVADCGIGIRRSLAKNSRFEWLPDDSAAVSTALAPGGTSVPGPARGTGLYVSKLIITENGGRLVVRSGQARVTTPADGSSAAALPHFDGTLITALVRSDRALDLSVVIRGLERIGGLKSVVARESIDSV